MFMVDENNGFIVFNYQNKKLEREIMFRVCKGCNEFQNGVK